MQCANRAVGRVEEQGVFKHETAGSIDIGPAFISRKGPTLARRAATAGEPVQRDDRGLVVQVKSLPLAP